VRFNKIAAILSAASLSLSPVAANAASPLSVAHASTIFQDDGDAGHGGGSTAVILGVLLVVLLGVAAISGNGDHPGSP
jgi:hypothetical protein